MRRRAFLSLVGGAAATWPLAVRAQQPGKPPTIGFLGADAAGWRPWTDAFVARLRELGWIDGQTIAIDYRWTEGHPERVAEIAASNVTGLSLQDTDLAGKRLELLREIVPSLRRLAMLTNIGSPQAAPETSEVHAAARKLGLEIVPLDIRRAEDIAAAFEGLKAQADAVYVLADPIFTVNRNQIITLALGARLPTIFNARAYVQGGGLMSYGPDFSDLFRRCAELVDKILHGAKPGDIPVEQPTKFELAINLKTAKALGLTVPPSLLVTADEVIE